MKSSTTLPPACCRSFANYWSSEEQACSALVDRLLRDTGDQIELRPMSKFPVVRDLMVNRRRLFRAMERLLDTR